MEEIHSCGNQCKKLNTNELLMQRMITYVQKFYFNETFFILLWLFTSVVDFFFILFFQSTRLELPLKTHRKVITKHRRFKKKKNKIATNVIDFAKKHTGMYHEIFHPVGCWFYSHLFNINNIILKHCDIFTNFVY